VKEYITSKSNFLQMEGREESDSEVEDKEDAEGDAMRAAVGDGAMVVSQADARIGNPDGRLLSSLV